MYGYVYRTTNLINGKIYIGKHRSEGFDTSYKGSGSLLWKAINKYGWESFSTELLASCFSLEELNEEEKLLISYFDSNNRSIGYNILPGGDGGALYGELNGFYGKHHTPEVRSIIREALLNAWQDDEYRENAHISRLGNQNSAGTIWIHKGDQDKRANKYNLDSYLEQGWELGCSPSSTEKKRQASLGRKNNLGKIRIHKDDQGKMVDQVQLQSYLNLGWELGMNPASASKRLGKKAPPNRQYHLVCKKCGLAFLGRSPTTKMCDNCKSGVN